MRGVLPVSPPVAFAVSAPTRAALLTRAVSVAEQLPRSNLNQAHVRDAVRREGAEPTRYDWRLALVAASTEDVRARLVRPLGTDSGVYVGSRRAGIPPKVALVFSGHGSQWPGMLGELASLPSAQDSLRDLGEFFQGLREGYRLPVPRSLPPHFLTEDLDFNDVSLLQPAIFAVQVVLNQALRRWGLRPDAVCGHSMGEVAAAHASGALNLRDAATIAYRRSQVLSRLAGTGGMVSVGASAVRITQALGGWPRGLSVASRNSPTLTVLSSDNATLQFVQARLEQESLTCRRLDIDAPAHSPALDPYGPELHQRLRATRPSPTLVPFYSTVTASVLPGPELNAAYWVRNVRETVDFAGTVARLIADGHTIFVEVGPHPVLGLPIRQVLQAAGCKGVVASAMHNGTSLATSLLSCGAHIFAEGLDLDILNLAL